MYIYWTILLENAIIPLRTANDLNDVETIANTSWNGSKSFDHVV